jgi:hypothetical protein
VLVGDTAIVSIEDDGNPTPESGVSAGPSAGVQPISRIDNPNNIIAKRSFTNCSPLPVTDNSDNYT